MWSFLEPGESSIFSNLFLGKPRFPRFQALIRLVFFAVFSEFHCGAHFYSFFVLSCFLNLYLGLSINYLQIQHNSTLSMSLTRYLAPASFQRAPHNTIPSGGSARRSPPRKGGGGLGDGVGGEGPSVCACLRSRLSINSWH